jgi:hypothetical protein
MIFLYYVLYFIAAGLMVNGLFHFLMGMLGKKFVSKPRMLSQKTYDQMKARKSSFSSAVYNVIYGMVHFLIAFLIFFMAGNFKFGLTLETGIVFFSIFINSIFVAWNFEGTLS